MEKGQNTIYSPHIKRTINYSDDFKQINIFDQRYYKKDEKYYPSVSTILNCYPKGKFFEDWIKANGFNSEIIAAQAADEGRQVHDACERFVKGETINWIDKNGNIQYSLEVWKMILKFTEFWKRYKPELIALEYHLFSDKYEFAGTADLIVKLNNEMWLIDLKTSNSLHTTYDLQLSAYATAWNETHDTPIIKTGILWLKAATRTDKEYQGKGWQIKIIDDIEKNMQIFNKIYDIYKLENPNDKPIIHSFPTSVELD